MNRVDIYNILNSVAPCKSTMDLDGVIKQDTLGIKKSNSIGGISNDLGGWTQWKVFVYSPSNPLQVDRLALKVKKQLMKNEIEITHELGEDFYDPVLKCYTTVISFRLPSTLYYK